MFGTRLTSELDDRTDDTLNTADCRGETPTPITSEHHFFIHTIIRRTGRRRDGERVADIEPAHPEHFIHHTSNLLLLLQLHTYWHLSQTPPGTRGQSRTGKSPTRHIHIYKAWAWSSSVENHTTKRPHIFNVHKPNDACLRGKASARWYTHQHVVVLTHPHTLPYMHTFIVSRGGIGARVGEKRRANVRTFLNSKFLPA